MIANSGTDALSFLHSQTPNPEERLLRGNKFWEQAFQPLEVMPARVPMPNHVGECMLGIVAERKIEAKTVVIRGRGFWWPKHGDPPSASSMGFKWDVRYTKPHNVHMPWGVDLPDVAAGLRYVMNSTSPMSLVNDFRGIAGGPNASLVAS